MDLPCLAWPLDSNHSYSHWIGDWRLFLGDTTLPLHDAS
jgi:hypothetical protein